MKKIWMLVLLLLLLGGIVVAQTFRSVPTAQPVPEDVAKQAEAAVCSFLDAVRARDRKQTIALSAFASNDAAREGVARAIGDSRDGTFELHGIDFDGEGSGRLVLIGFFPSGDFLKAVVAQTPDGYKVMSITEP